MLDWSADTYELAAVWKEFLAITAELSSSSTPGLAWFSGTGMVFPRTTTAEVCKKRIGPSGNATTLSSTCQSTRLLAVVPASLSHGEPLR